MILRDHREKLQYFYHGAKAGSVKEAAYKINITQPSLTKSIQVLEGSIDRKRFVRQPRGVKLTLEGELLFKYCHQLFAELNDVELKLKAPEDPMAGSLRVGTYDSIAIYFWPYFLREFLPKYPMLSIELNTGRSTDIQQWVEEGELDLGLIIEPKETNHLNRVMLYEDRFKLYATLSETPIYTSNEKAPLIFMPDALAGEKDLPLMKSHPSLENNFVRKLYKTSSLESCKELMIKGIGIALLPEMVAKRDLEKGFIEEVKLEGFPEEGIGEHHLGLVYAKHRQDSETLQRLIQEIKEQGF